VASKHKPACCELDKITNSGIAQIWAIGGNCPPLPASYLISIREGNSHSHSHSHNSALTPPRRSYLISVHYTLQRRATTTTSSQAKKIAHSAATAFVNCLPHFK
jgi:hypothetical protein